LCQQQKPDLSEVIAENFGANATYVEGLLSRFRSNPNLVDESWRAYFSELLGDGYQATQTDISDNGSRTTATVPTEAAAPPVSTAAKPAPAKKAETPTVAPAATPGIEMQPIRGAALKIVENMEASISVPTATSQRRIPV
jgi:2-oxoglutarate dehydrogenase E1 component